MCVCVCVFREFSVQYLVKWPLNSPVRHVKACQKACLWSAGRWCGWCRWLLAGLPGWSGTVCWGRPSGWISTWNETLLRLEMRIYIESIFMVAVWKYEGKQELCVHWQHLNVWHLDFMIVLRGARQLTSLWNKLSQPGVKQQTPSPWKPLITAMETQLISYWFTN